MSYSYTIEPIGPKTIDRAYPLAQTVIPALTQHEWRQCCHSNGRSSFDPEAEREEIVVARNAERYVKGLCVYAIRDHASYDRVVDVPLFLAASAADGEGVTAELLDFLRTRCDRSVCSGIRFWMMDTETWRRRLRPEHIARTDHGLFLPALTSVGGIEKALLAQGLGAAAAIDRTDFTRVGFFGSASIFLSLATERRGCDAIPGPGSAAEHEDYGLRCHQTPEPSRH